MSSAAIVFNQSIKDAQELLVCFDQENSGSAIHNPETLKRAGLVMAMAITAWETYVKSRITEEIEVWLRSVDGSPIGKFVRRRLNEDLKRFYNPNSEKTKRKIFVTTICTNQIRLTTRIPKTFSPFQ